MYSVRMLTTLDPNNASFVAEFSMMYETSFPSEERRPVQELLLDQAKGMYTIYVSVHNNAVSGMITLFRPSNSRVVLLDYFAVHPKLRSQGQGLILFKDLVALCEENGEILCLEVEQPVLHTQEDIRWRRIGFYRRGGAVLLQDFVYLLPDLDKSGIITKMHLMFAGMDYHTPLRRDELAEFMHMLFVQLYKRHPEDAILQQNVLHLPQNMVWN